MPNRGVQQARQPAPDEASAPEGADAFMDTWPRTQTREKRVRRIDLANVSVNATQLIAIIGLVWAAAGMYKDIMAHLERTDDRLTQIQSQIGETNSRLFALERK